MREMKDSGIEWIGQIPQEWYVDRLKYCANLDSEKLSEKTDSEYAFNYIDISSVTEYGGIGSTQEMTFEKSPSRARMVVHDGDTIISTVRTYLKAIAYIDGLEDHICSTGFCVVTPNEKLHPKFGYYLMQSDYFVQKIVSESVGVSYPAISSTEIGNMSIAIPAPEEQARIACYLDGKCAEIDALIAAKEKTNTLLKERRQSIIYEAVTKGLNPDAPMKDSGIEWIGQIPEHWEVERLKPHIDFNPKTAIPEYQEDDGVSFVPMDCLRRGVHTSQTVDYCKVKSGYVDFAEGDILMAKVTPCLENGNLAIAENLIDGVGFGSTEINVIRCKSIHTEYLFYILQCKTYVDRAVADMYGVAGLKRLNPNFIPNTKCPMPSIEEQQKIAEYLAATCGEIDELVVANQRTIEKLKEYRQSVIYEAVTGKIEV